MLPVVCWLESKPGIKGMRISWDRLRLANRLRGDLILLFTAMIWGSAFVAQRVAAQELGNFWFNGSRFVLGVLVLLPLVRFRLRFTRGQFNWAALGGGLIFVAGNLQQAGLATTTAANAGFLTTLYTIFVPLILAVVWKQRSGWRIWVAAILAILGGWLLSTGGMYEPAAGDVLEVLGAFVWAFHVIVISRAVKAMDALQFAIGQFIVCALLNLGTAAIVETFPLDGFLNTWWTVVYAGVLSVGVAYTLQVVGQKYAPPGDAAILLSMEAVFAALFGFLLIQEGLTMTQLAGCGLILGAVLLVQLRGRPEDAHE